MDKQPVSRRTFVGGVAVGGAAAALGYLGLKEGNNLWSQGVSPAAAAAAPQGQAARTAGAAPAFDYDAMAKIANNENPYGPPESVMKAMMDAMKYANRYGYPDGGITKAIADHHGVKEENVLLAAGSGEILEVVGLAFLKANDKVVGVEPTYGSVYQQATSIKADAIRVPLLPDFRQDTPALIKATNRYYREIGFVYLCNPNNPTGRIIPKNEIKQILDGIPEDMPVLIDEAYHHFVDNAQYAASTPYVLEGRQVIIARTFSKIVGLAGMRLGYAIAPTPLIDRMRPWSTGTINAPVKWGGVAALKDTAAQDKVKKITIELRKKTVADLQAFGYSSIPSDGNFFMVHIKRNVQPVISAFREKGVLVGRPFPPMNEHLRVSVGTADEMDRFTKAFKEIFSKPVA